MFFSSFTLSWGCIRLLNSFTIKESSSQALGCFLSFHCWRFVNVIPMWVLISILSSLLSSLEFCFRTQCLFRVDISKPKRTKIIKNFADDIFINTISYANDELRPRLLRWYEYSWTFCISLATILIKYFHLMFWLTRWLRFIYMLNYSIEQAGVNRIKKKMLETYYIKNLFLNYNKRKYTQRLIYHYEYSMKLCRKKISSAKFCWWFQTFQLIWYRFLYRFLYVAYIVKNAYFNVFYFYPSFGFNRLFRLVCHDRWKTWVTEKFRFQTVSLRYSVSIVAFSQLVV